MSIVIGTWPLSGDFGHVSLEQVASTLRACVDLGFREFDTAPNYGNGFIEFCLGKEVAGIGDMEFNTKFGSHPFLRKDFEPKALARSLDDSLTRLGVDRVNTVFLHNPRDEVKDYGALLDLFEGLKRQGKILKSGISLAKGHDYPVELLRQFDVIQDDANLLCLARLQERERWSTTEFMARSPLATGILGGKIDEDTQFAEDDHRSMWLKGERLKSILRRVAAIQQTTDLPLPELAQRFLLSQPQVDRVIAGVRTPEHVHQLAWYQGLPSLSQALMNELRELYERDFDLIDELSLGY